MLEIRQEGVVLIFIGPWCWILYSVMDSRFSFRDDWMIFRGVISDAVVACCDTLRFSLGRRQPRWLLRWRRRIWDSVSRIALRSHGVERAVWISLERSRRELSICVCGHGRTSVRLSMPKIAKIKENIMLSLMQCYHWGDSELVHPRQRHEATPRPIWTAGHGGLFWHEGVFPSLRAQNSENQREYHDIIDAMVELSGRQVDTSKRTPWGRSTYDLECRAWMVVLAQGCVSLCQSKKQRKSKRISWYHSFNGTVEVTRI